MRIERKSEFVELRTFGNFNIMTLKLRKNFVIIFAKAAKG